METIDDFLQAIPTLTRDQLMVLAAEHADHDAGREAAWASARRIIEDRGLGAEMSRVRTAVIDWATRPVSSPTQWAEIPMGSGLLEQDVRRSAALALLDAAAAVLLGDALDPAHRDVLLAPWDSASADA